MSEDYRNTSRCIVLSDVIQKKNTLEHQIRNEHRRAKIMYNFIKDKQGGYFKDFAKLYNHKCAYCGASVRFTDIRLFEVDHFICESAYPNNTDGRAQAGKVENLAFSCYSCNRGKGDLHIKEAYQTLLNPDTNSIACVFVRDDEYYIKIKADFCKDKSVRLFYEKLMLGSEARRLDFLLLEMDNLITQLRSNNIGLANRLEQCKSKLMEKKNCTLI